MATGNFTSGRGHALFWMWATFEKEKEDSCIADMRQCYGWSWLRPGNLESTVHVPSFLAVMTM